MSWNFCSVEGCNGFVRSKGLCNAHYQRQYLYGRLEKVQGIIKGNCIVDGCDKIIKGHGYCNTHYALWRKHGKAEKLKREKRNHPFYALWFERKQTNNLCNEWLDFTTFVAAISPKPEGNYLLIRLKEGPFGPDNFKWQECLKRKKEETTKEWNARQRAAQISKHPSMESDRNIRRTFGLTREQYNEILKSQNGGCGICGQQETAKSRTGGTKQLAVDHCHTTSKIRGLLCSSCNTTLGRTNDSVEHLQSMINYLLKHKEA